MLSLLHVPTKPTTGLCQFARCVTTAAGGGGGGCGGIGGSRQDTTGRNPKSKNYIDRWHAATVKPTSFYERLAEPGRKRKCYFYSVDLQGRVFLEEVIPKNIATSLKSVKFLDFFFRHMKHVGRRERPLLVDCAAEHDYPYVSPCGVELNFVRPADKAIVFIELRDMKRSGDDDSKGKELVFGGSLAQPFFPDRLAMSKRTGRLYHELVADIDEECSLRDKRDGVGRTKEKAPLTPLHASTDQVEYGLIKSSVAVQLSERIVEGGVQDDDECESESTALHLGTGLEYSGMDFVSFDAKRRYPIAWIPDACEPGPWGLPVEDDEESF